MVVGNFPVDPKQKSILGHSMGGHGALTVALRHPDRSSRTWRRYLLSGLAAWLAIAAPASAFIAYVSNEKSNTVSVIDTEKWAVISTIKVGQRPRGIEFTRDGKFVMVAAGDDDTIQMIDAKTQEVVDSLPSGPDPELFTQDAQGKILYVANENDNTVTIIDLEKRVRLGDIQVGVEPEGMAISPDGKILSAVCSNSRESPGDLSGGSCERTYV